MPTLMSVEVRALRETRESQRASNPVNTSMARTFLTLAIIAGGMLSVIAPAQAQFEEECAEGCNCDGPYYPQAAFNPASLAPMPGEAPSSYFTRQYHRSRGPYGEFATQYEVFPEQWETQQMEIAEDASPESFASFNNAEPSELSESYVDDYATDVGGPTNQKPGVFQKWALRATYIPDGGGAGGFGQTDLETWVVFGLPFPTRDTPLLITPGYASRLLEVPAGVDLPDTLYDMYVQFRWLGKLDGCWGYDIVFTPGIYSDLETNSDEEFRITSRALATYQWSPWTQLIFGVGYFNREDFDLLPIGGAIYTPCDDVRWEFIFPRPRYARRYYASCDREDWWYIAGEFGGGSWAIERAGGADDVVTLADYRLLIGKEVKLNGGASRLFEVGYVFGREIQYRSATPTVELDSSFVVRGSIAF